MQGYDDQPPVPDSDILPNFHEEIPHNIIQLTPAARKPFPWGVTLGAAGCGLGVVAMVVALGFSTTTIHQTVNQDVSRSQAAEVRTLQGEVAALQGQVAADSSKMSGQLGKLSGQVNSITYLGKYGEVCTEPGFDFPCTQG